jgi:hypothetical protein
MERPWLKMGSTIDEEEKEKKLLGYWKGRQLSGGKA